MNPIAKRKIRQNMQSCSDETFWKAVNIMLTQAYKLGRKHVVEAMECTSGISRTQVDAVQAKATEIQEDWDGLQSMDVDRILDGIMKGG